MIKRTLYPKTKRVPMKRNIVVTEKLDGSNITFFKLEGTLYIGSRNNIHCYSDKGDFDKLDYKGLKGWLNEFGNQLLHDLCEGSAICCEWRGMGAIRYDRDIPRLNMFAKANCTMEKDFHNILYKHDLFIYSFREQVIPSYVALVPVVTELDHVPTIEELDVIYDKYSFGKRVEGFVIALNDTDVEKYVRRKKNVIEPHFEKWEYKLKDRN